MMADQHLAGRELGNRRALEPEVVFARCSGRTRGENEAAIRDGHGDSWARRGHAAAELTPVRLHDTRLAIERRGLVRARQVCSKKAPCSRPCTPPSIPMPT